jgi:hypothetical protein
MEYVISFDTDFGGVEIKTSGEADLAGLLGHATELARDERYVPGMPVLIDHSELDATSVPSADLASLGLHVTTLASRLGDSRVAVVVPNALAYGLGRTAQARQETQIDMRLVHSRAEALAFLRRPGD